HKIHFQVHENLDKSSCEVSERFLTELLPVFFESKDISDCKVLVSSS
ncbi:14285_t:CDS:1, partial [Rhizophagus irregularis]